MIVKLMKIKFHKLLKIGHVMDFSIKQYLDKNTGVGYKVNEVKNYIMEFRFINGRRFVYKEPYKDLGYDEISDIIADRIKSIKEFLDLVIVSIEL